MFLPHYQPPYHTPNFFQIGQKTQKLEIFTFVRFQLVGLAGQKMVVGILNSFYVVFAPIISPHTKFHPNLMKNMEVENFHIWSILFGRAGRLINGRRNSKLILSCVFSLFSSLAKSHPNRTKNTEVRNFHFWSILVGWAGRSKNGRRYFKLIL